MTLLCPAVCMTELSSHHVGDEADGHVALTESNGQNQHRPHHEHDPSGDPDPHGEHTCLCTGGTPPGAALQIPALEPAPAIAADVLFLTNLDAASLLHRLNANSPTDTSSGLRCAPLLI